MRGHPQARGLLHVRGGIHGGTERGAFGGGQGGCDIPQYFMEEGRSLLEGGSGLIMRLLQGRQRGGMLLPRLLRQRPAPELYQYLMSPRGMFHDAMGT